MSSVIACFLSQHTLRWEGDAGLTGASSMGGKCAESPPTFIRGKRLKNRKRCGLRTLSVKGSGVVFTHGEGISTPRVRHKGWQPLIKCANMTSKCFIFLFTFFCVFYAFCIFYLFVVDKGVSLAPTYSAVVIRKSDLRSSFRTKRWLSKLPTETSWKRYGSASAWIFSLISSESQILGGLNEFARPSFHYL